MIQRHSGIPLHIQIKHDIETKIRKGEWRPSQQIPTEDELCSLYGVSRITVRRALADLVQSGLLSRIPGKGTFVTQTIPEQNLIQVINFATEEQVIEGPHHVVSTQVLSAEPAVAAKLQLQSGEQVVRLERIKLSHDVPVALEISYIPLAIASNLLEKRLETLIIYQYLRDQGVQLTHAKMYLQPYVLTNHEATLLRMATGSPVFLWERLSYTAQGVPVELAQFIIRSDNRRFYIQYSIDQ